MYSESDTKSRKLFVKDFILRLTNNTFRTYLYLSTWSLWTWMHSVSLWIISFLISRYHRNLLLGFSTTLFLLITMLYCSWSSSINLFLFTMKTIKTNRQNVTKYREFKAERSGRSLSLMNLLKNFFKFILIGI